MSSDRLRSALRISFVFLTAFVLCLLLPRSLRAADIGTVQVPGLSDLRDCTYQAEIGAALRLGYMSGADTSSFKPDGRVRAKDFLACIKRGMSKVGLTSEAECKIGNPNAVISRQQAVKMLVTSVLTPEQVELIGQQCGGPPLYLCDFVDAGDVASWAEAYVAAAVYRGWIPERYRLYPKEDASREFVATLLVRAFPDPSAYSGLVVYVSDPSFRRAQCIQIVSDDPASEAVCPAADGMPSMSFTSSPGLASYSASLDDARERRVGSNPLEVTGTRVQRGRGGRIQIVLPAEDAREVLAANDQGLFLKTWRVAIVTGAAPGARSALRISAPAPAQ